MLHGSTRIRITRETLGSTPGIRESDWPWEVHLASLRTGSLVALFIQIKAKDRPSG
jgi:hypothetical protein